MRLLTGAAAFLMCLIGVSVSAHTGAINLFVNSENRLYPLEPFEIPQFVEFLGIEISTDGPGFGVNFPSQGVAVDASLSIDVAFDLLYWDGIGLAEPASAITMEAPTFDNQGEVITSPISEYIIGADSGFQSGINWGTYNGANFWEAHGLNFLNPLPSAAGIYGAVFQVNSSHHLTSYPFVVPFVYDPNDQWDPAGEDVGVQRLRDAAGAVRFADLNVDGHVDTADVDLLVAEIANGTSQSEFDLNDDAVVDEADLGTWLEKAALVNLPLGTTAYLRGDANLDGIVDGLDFIEWNGSKFQSVAAWSQGDFNADGVVDGLDFIQWNDNKFLSANDLQASVPEPTAWFLLMVAIGFLRHQRLV